MKRKDALPLIKKVQESKEFRTYINPNLSGVFMVADSLSDQIVNDLPDWMDRLQAIAFAADKLIQESSVELVDVPTTDGSMMGQLEVFIGPRQVPIYVIHLDGDFWLSEEEWFPFPAECNHPPGCAIYPPAGKKPKGRLSEPPLTHKERAKRRKHKRRRNRRQG